MSTLRPRNASKSHNTSLDSGTHSETRPKSQQKNQGQNNTPASGHSTRNNKGKQQNQALNEPSVTSRGRRVESQFEKSTSHGTSIYSSQNISTVSINSHQSHASSQNEPPTSEGEAREYLLSAYSRLARKRKQPESNPASGGESERESDSDRPLDKM